jgi:hypothetical protein
MSRFEENRSNPKGWVTAGIGGAMLVPGVILWLTSGTSVMTTEGQTLASTKDPSSSRSHAPRLSPIGLVF